MVLPETLALKLAVTGQADTSVCNHLTDPVISAGQSPLLLVGFVVPGFVGVVGVVGSVGVVGFVGVVGVVGVTVVFPCNWAKETSP